MSLILDALNRSEGERPEPENAPGLQARHGPSGDERAPAWRRWLMPGLVVLLIIALAATWLREPTETPTQASANEAATEAASVAAPEAVAPQTAMQEQMENRGPSREQMMAQRKAMRDLAVQAAARQAAARNNSANRGAMQADVAALYATPAEGAALPPAVDMQTAAARPERRSISISQAPANPSSAQNPPSPAPAEAPALDVDALTEAAQLALAQKPIIEHAAPTIDELSQRTKDEIPSIFFSEHRWSSNPRERSVVLNGSPHREGDTIKPGLKLVEILEDSIVMDYRGTEFRLRSLNSWVNL